MNPPLQQRLKALFSEYDSPLSDLRFVMFSNLGSAFVMAIAICVAVWGGAAPIERTFICSIAALTLLLFALLTVCMVLRYAFWLPAGLVSLVNGASIGAVLWGLAYLYCPPARWPGGVVGLVLGFIWFFRVYARVSTIAQKATTSS